MPINLLKLPRLVGLLVVNEMEEYQDIFLLSLCSRGTYFLVEKANMKAPKLEFRYGDSSGYNTFEIEVVTDKIRMPVLSVIHVHKMASRRTFTVLGYDYVTAATIDLWRENDGKYRPRISCANEPMAIQMALQDHVNSIFHYSGTHKLDLSMRRKGSLPNITNVIEIEIKHVSTDPQFLTGILTTYPHCDTISVFSRIVGDVPNNSPFSRIQNFYVPYGPYGCRPDYIHNFVGRNMYLSSASITEQDLIHFLHEWISNEAYYDLETMTISAVCRINPGLIQRAIEFEEYDPNEPEKRPEFLTFDIPYFGSTPMKYHLRDRSFVEIKRITDGRRAFLAIDDSKLRLLVHKG